MQKKPNDFGQKYGNQKKKTWRKCWMDKHYKRTKRNWRRPQNGNTHWLTQNNTEKNIKLENARPWWNTWLLVQGIHLHSRQTSTRNEQMPTRRASTWLDDQRKDYINPKGPKQRNCSKQLQSDNLPTNDVENTNSTNKGKDLLLLTNRGLFPDELKGCCKGSRGKAELLYIDQHILNESKTRLKNKSYSLDWLQKGIWYGSTKLDNTLSQNVQNIRWSHKLHRQNHENLESGIDSRRKKISWSKEMLYHLYYS